MKQDLRSQLIHLANHFGADPQYVRAGGGNASFKQNGLLHIKASGTTLAGLRGEDLVPLRMAPLLDAVVAEDQVDGDPVMVVAEKARVGDVGGRRPSVEILFHALIPDPLVLHLHPLVANAVTCNEQGKELTARVLGNDAVWVDYIDPGVPLARGIAAAREEFESRTGSPPPAITMLGNHGIIVSGHSFDEVAERTEWLTTTIRAAIPAASRPDDTQPHPDRTSNLDALAEHFRTNTAQSAVVHDADAFLTQTSQASAGPVTRGPLIPDQIVYAGSLPVLLRSDDDAETVDESVTQFRATHGHSPIIAVVPGVAAFAVGDSDKAARNALDTYRDALRVARDADLLGRVRVMDERERHFIETWEAEAYRRSVAASE